jgi:hypothetical protein
LRARALRRSLQGAVAVNIKGGAGADVGTNVALAAVPAWAALGAQVVELVVGRVLGNGAIVRAAIAETTAIKRYKFQKNNDTESPLKRKGAPPEKKKSTV